MADSVSRQRLWQLKQRKLGNCRVCGKPAGKSTRVNQETRAICPSCSVKTNESQRVKLRERQRVNKGYKTRYMGAKSYKENN